MNQRELDILNILWRTWLKEERALIVADIVQIGMRDGVALTQSTVTAVLRKMLNAGLVEVTGVISSGKVLSRTYKPSQASKDRLLNYFVAQYNLFNEVISIDELYAALKNSSQPTE